MAPPCEWYRLVSQPEIAKKIHKTPYFGVQDHSRSLNSAPIEIQCTTFYHTSHDSVSVVRTTFKVNGKRQSLTLSQPKTPKPIVTKSEWRDYVVDAQHQKIGLNPSRGFCSPYRWNIHPSCSKFTTLFWCLNSPTGESVRPIFTLNT